VGCDDASRGLALLDGTGINEDNMDGIIAREDTAGDGVLANTVPPF